ncbi:HDOD domain-containing protein [Massilia forsythiae]|uniref:HDOD domain-containing protein n=2 Tax=Massilia forsythiae TaxID=2728020 RepID=A0A7Z2ZWW2_9BURK|nr:HDOD domain-containing protein [Massilia forsythiae]
MPGFTRAINAILASMRGEDERDFSMTQTVLSDPVLTQKVLRLANSGMYSAFGQRVNTVSKALLVLGTEAIGHLALGLKLIEELGKSTPDSLQAHIEMEKAVLAGMVAQQVALASASRDPEEAVVCSILHSLGRMMVTFYLPEQWAGLQQADSGADAAAADRLGLSLEQIGRATAEHWGLPRNLIAGMHSIEPGERGEGFGHDDWLAALGTMSTRCAESLWNDDEAGAERVRELAAGFAPLLGVAPDGILGAVEKARLEAAADLSIAPLAQSSEKRALETKNGAARLREAGNKILADGVADMRDAAAGATPGQMMSMALETAYRGLSFTRAFGFLRNRRDGRYSARIGLGEGAKAMLPRLTFGDAFQSDVFFAALGSDHVIFIENARDPKFAAKLPGWWKGTLAEGRCFVIIPLCTHGEPVGFLYGDWDESFPSVFLNQAEFALLNELRALVVGTVDRRQAAETAQVRS